jgi:CheY-specific phosphatase CheX
LPATDRVSSLVREASELFFQSVGIVDVKILEESCPVAFDKEHEILSSMLGFSGQKIKAALVVESNHAGVAATNPQREYKKNLDLTDHSDWIGEIANQIVGNLKRIFRRYGVDFTMGTPVVMSGSSIHLVSGNQSYSAVVYSIDKHYMKISFSVDLSKNVDIETVNEEFKDETSGGDAFLF